MTECPDCHETGEYSADNHLTSVFWCRNDDCRVASFDHIPVNAAKAMGDDDER